MNEQVSPNEKAKKSKQGRSDRGLLGLFRRNDGSEDEVEFVTVREEKRRIRRVLKPKPMARSHPSEAFEPPPLTKEAIEITEKVIESVAPVAAIPTPRRSSGFRCAECGTMVPMTAERCPGCHVRYIKDVSDEDLKALEAAEASGWDDEEPEMALNPDSTPVVHFDAESGVMNYLTDTGGDPDFMLECGNCGTAIEFNTDRCPICGSRLEQADIGIASLFRDMDFEWDRPDELRCPSCGEHVKLVDGRCPSCNELISEDHASASDKVDPIIHNENVVFVHLDVESGEVNFLQRLAKKLGFEHLTVQLESVGRGGFDENWKSLSRI